MSDYAAYEPMAPWDVWADGHRLRPVCVISFAESGERVFEKRPPSQATTLHGKHPLFYVYVCGLVAFDFNSVRVMFDSSCSPKTRFSSIIIFTTSSEKRPGCGLTLIPLQGATPLQRLATSRPIQAESSCICHIAASIDMPPLCVIQWDSDDLACPGLHVR